jgi:diguanylate cyclase (GGDEF)-like protein
MFDATECVLRLVSCNVFTNEDLAKVVIPLGEGAPGIIAETRKPLYIANLHEDPRIPEIGRAIHGAKSSIGFPLICREELLGVIAFDAESVREFSDREIQLFENITGQVSLVIYNARLLAKFEHLSITDGLTGAYNHRYFQVKLAESLRAAQQKSTPLSLLFIDLDHFKNYNDTFGHPRGDELLKEFTQVLMDIVRQSDPVCRYGGEEFAIILQDCPTTKAVQIAERIRVACENQKFYGRERLSEKKVTISIGVASYPEITTCQELIAEADQALYQAKRSRNRVECFKV